MATGCSSIHEQHGELSLRVPSAFMNLDRAYPAGELKEIVLIESNPVVYPSTYLVWSDDLFSTIIHPSCDDGKCSFLINDRLSRRAGVKELSLVSLGITIDRRQITISPLGIAKHVESYVGPKTVQVDLDEPAMITAVAIDRYGNALADGTEISITERSARGISTEAKILTECIVGHKLINRPQTTEVVYIAAKTTAGFSKEQVVQGVTGLPAAIELSVQELIPYADNRQISSFETSSIKDLQGNTIPDGSMIYLHVDGIQGVSKYSAFTVDGKAKFSVPNPDRKSSWTLHALTSTGATSNQLEVSYESNLTNIPLQLNTEEQQLIVGPLTGYLGQYIADGTEVRVALRQDERLIEKVHYVEDGFIQVSVGDYLFSKGILSIAVSSCGIVHQQNFEI